MAENKTRATGASVQEHVAALANDEQRSDCESLIRLLRKVTREDPRMWGPSIVGFGSYRYQCGSGRHNESCLTGFAVRGKDLVVYLTAAGPEQETLLAKLGRHRMGKACLYLKRLDDVDLGVLEQLVAGSVAAVQRRSG